MRSQFWGPRIFELDKNMTMILAMEPFDANFYSHGSDSAWPPDRSHGVMPSVLDVQWEDPSLDDQMAEILLQISGAIHDSVIADGQDDSARYVNYAYRTTPLEDIYGKNLKRLHKIKKKFDPENVMGLAGGWKF
jgi:hypothetical protein